MSDSMNKRPTSGPEACDPAAKRLKLSSNTKQMETTTESGQDTNTVESVSETNFICIEPTTITKHPSAPIVGMNVDKRTLEFLPDTQVSLDLDLDMEVGDFEDEMEFDESICFLDERNKSKRDLLRRISAKLLSLDSLESSIESDCSSPDSSFDAVSYMASVPDDTRISVSNYLSSGILNDVTLSMTNIHHVYHVARGLHLKQLRKHCLEFCSNVNQDVLLEQFKECVCFREVRKEAKAGYERLNSLISNPDDSSPPEYFIIFCRNRVDHKDNVIVKVMDMSERMQVFTRKLDKQFKNSANFQCCSCEIDECPFVFFSGGEGRWQDSFWKYDVLLGRWEKCARLLHGRTKHCMLAHGNSSIFVLGGKEVACIEEYNIKTNKWTECASLCTQVASAACALYDNKIYILGGKTKAGPVATVQCFDICSRKTYSLPHLPYPVYSGQVVVCNRMIYLASSQGHMISFDPESGNSHLCAMQPITRKHFGMFKRNERVYIVGGISRASEDTADQLLSSYRYNPEKDEWMKKDGPCHSCHLFTSCTIRYPQQCSVIPFNDRF